MPETTDFLYPFIEGDETDSGTLLEDLARSAEGKWSQSSALRQATLTQSAAQLQATGAAMAELFRAGGRLFTFGNGGSATDASDLAWALGQKGWALSDDVATVTALANDVSFDVVFARQLATLARPGDAVVALSTSGTSANVVAGLREAQRLGLSTIGFAGYDGGDMASAGLDACCVVRSSSVHRIQESYVTMYDEAIRRASAS